MKLTVECKPRPEGSKPNALRREGWIPAVLYGHDGDNSVSLVVDEKSVQKLLKEPAASTSLIDLNVPELSWTGKTLLREVQTHPWKGYPYHISFFSIATQDSIQVDLPLNFVGEPVGLKSGGILEAQVTEISVRCAPTDMPESLDIDVSALDIGKSLHLDEIVFPEGVEPVTDTNLLIAAIQIPRGVKAEEGEGDAESALETPEVIGEA
ncbi:50S ribosomal protein L25/general stress protein Ctc [Leptolyngbya valderiana BDU 20041]|nr:50S ribosomal protein L25/general stress protein Ctc [Leptolyngbya valderiana BDU 20041]PPT09711.1 LSU ribosomal protein L25p [Geitlerinema sp. FC II]